MKTLLVVLSELCNLDCSYCDMEKTSSKSIDEKLYIQEFKKLRAQYPNEVIKIDFFGGEPLLQLDKVKYIIDNLNDDNVKLFMPTNGLVLTKDKLDYLQENNVEISLSFDGLWQDTNRKQLTGKGTLSKYEAKGTLFNGLKCHTMITEGNYNLLENHLYIEDTFGLNSEMTLVRDRGIWDIESVNQLQHGIKELIEWYTNNTHKTIPFFILFYLRHFLLYESKGVTTDTCGAGTNLFSFSEDKTIACNRFKDDQKAVDSIPEYTRMSACSTCEVRNYCKKGCLFEQIKNEGPIVDLCSIYKYTYKHIAEMVSTLKDDANFKIIVMEELKNEYESD